MERDLAYKIGLNWEPMPGVEPVFIDVAKFDEVWKNSDRRDGWFDKQEEGRKGKRLRFIQFAQNHRPSEIHAPTVFIELTGIRFVDGRHRYCVLRDAGVRWMKIGGFHPSDRIAGMLKIRWEPELEMRKAV